jgi:hypothetical protein
LSIRLEQHGLRSTPRRMSTWSSRNAVVFLRWRSTTSSDSEKLFVVADAQTAIASSIGLRRAFARPTDGADGNCGKRGIWEKSSHIPRFTPPRAGPCHTATAYAPTVASLPVASRRHWSLSLRVRRERIAMCSRLFDFIFRNPNGSTNRCVLTSSPPPSPLTEFPKDIRRMWPRETLVAGPVYEYDASRTVNGVPAAMRPARAGESHLQIPTTCRAG